MIPAKAFRVWERLYRRFSLEPFPAEGSQAAVETTIQPVTDADELLRTHPYASSTLDLSGGAGSYVDVFTVPDNRRWRVLMLKKSDTTLTSRLRVYTRLGVDFSLIAMTTAEVWFLHTFLLDQGDRIQARATGDSGDASRRFDIHYSEEEAY